LQGILLSLRGNEMRVAVKDADDVAEFRLECGVWISECCEPVTFQFPTAVFEAIGIVPDGENFHAEPEVLWNTNSRDVLAVDPLN
jgi:hypothetical protein